MDKYQTAKTLVDLLENRFKIGPFKFGLDPILGLVPEIGDTIGAILSLYIVYLAREMGLPTEKLAKMIGNIVLDFFMGAIPILGDAADFAFRSNSLNWKIIEDHFIKFPRDNDQDTKPITKIQETRY